MHARIIARRATNDIFMSPALYLTLFTLVFWIERETLPTLLLRLFPFAEVNPSGPCTGAPIPC